MATCSKQGLQLARRIVGISSSSFSFNSLYLRTAATTAAPSALERCTFNKAARSVSFLPSRGLGLFQMPPLTRSMHRFLSSMPTSASTSSTQPEFRTNPTPTLTQPSIVQATDGRQFAAFSIPTTERYQKLKPYIVKRRLNRMRTYEGAEKNIRHSPWRMNLVCQFAAGLPLTDAIQQLEFCKKSMAPLVQKVLIRTANLADIRDGLQHSQLEVAECFATKGSHLKRMKPMGRGRTGRMEHKFAHFRVVLREIDFKLKMYQAPTLNQKKRWFVRQQQAEADMERVQTERDELEQLERQAEDNKAKRSK